MKKQYSTLFRKTGILLFCLCLLSQARAQKQLVTKEKNQSPVTQEMINKVNEIVKPVKEQVDKRLNEDKTGAYRSYLEEVKRMNGMKSNKERTSYANKVNEKYASFFKEVWSGVKVDEKGYQERIRSVFPEQINRGLQFSTYLSFFIVVSYTPPPAPEPPADKCLDICTIAMGEITGDAALISSGGGSYGNCFLKADAWGAVAGGNNLYAYLRNGITIPGTLPNDGRKLHVRKRFELDQSATSFAGLGFGYAESRVSTYQAEEYMMAMTPVLGGSSKVNKKTISEDYIIEKKDVAKSIIKAYAGTMTYGISGNWCHSDCTGIRWTICEEK
jgi:hypothetical protein